MDLITKAIALKTTDYGESDKFILLYSLEHGKISVHAKGIRKAKAKLKFAGDTFCFGNYELAQTGDRFMLKTCEQLESFYTLREDIVCYYSACAIAECIARMVADADANRLRQMGDMMRDKASNVVAVLATVNGEKITFLAVCGKDAVAKGIKAGDLVKLVSGICGGKGGGKPDSAMGGGTDILKVDDALAAVDNFVAEKI